MNPRLLQLADMSWGKAFLIGLLLAGFYYMAAYNNGDEFMAELSTLQAETERAEQQLNETKKVAKDAEKFYTRVKEMIAQFDKIKEFMPEKLSKVDMMEAVAKTANESGVKLVKTDPQGEATKGPFYEMNKLSFTVSGTFPQVVTFLSNLSKVPWLMTFDRVEVETNKADSAADPEKPRLSFTGLLVGYRYRRQDTNPQAAAMTTPGGAPGAAQ